MKKMRLRKWVLYLLFAIEFFATLFILDVCGIIAVNGEAIPVLKFDILTIAFSITHYEIIKTTLKAIIKREKEEENKQN